MESGAAAGDTSERLQSPSAVRYIKLGQGGAWAAQAFAEKHSLAGTVGSDAHAAFELGRSLLLLDPFHGPGEMRAALHSALVQVRLSPPWFHLISRYASILKKIKTA